MSIGGERSFLFTASGAPVRLLRPRGQRRAAAARDAASLAAVVQRVDGDVTPRTTGRRFQMSGFAAFERPSDPRGRIPIVTTEQLRELMDVRSSARVSAVTSKMTRPASACSSSASA